MQIRDIRVCSHLQGRFFIEERNNKFKETTEDNMQWGLMMMDYFVAWCRFTMFQLTVEGSGQGVEGLDTEQPRPVP